MRKLQHVWGTTAKVLGYLVDKGVARDLGMAFAEVGKAHGDIEKRPAACHADFEKKRSDRAAWIKKRVDAWLWK